MLWYKDDVWEAFKFLWSKGRTGNEDKNTNRLTLITDGWSIQVRRSTANDNLTPGDTGLALDTWTCFALTYNAAGTSGERLKYYQGNLTTALTFRAEGGTGSGTVVDAGETLTVGGRGATESMNGKVAFFGHWNRVFPLGELKAQQYRMHVTSGCVVFSHYYAGIATDWSGLGNNGTITGATGADHVPLGPPFGFDVSSSHVPGRVMSSLVAHGGLAAEGGLAGIGGGLAAASKHEDWVNSLHV